MIDWRDSRVSPDGSHHVDAAGKPAYSSRFDEVLKFHPPGLAPVKLGDEAWHIHPDGTPAYPARFGRTFGFYEGFAAVVDGDGWHHVSPIGNSLYDQRYAWCGNFQGGRCTVRDESGGYMHIDQEGRPAYSTRWRYAGDFRDGIAVVQGSDGRSTHIDSNGRAIHPVWFEDLDVFHKGYARARDRVGWMHVDVAGQPAYDRRFAAVEPFYNGQARVECKDGSLAVINEGGQTVQVLRPPRTSEFAQLSSDLVGYWRTQTIAAAVGLGVPEHLPGTDMAVAAHCGLRPDGARRLLKALGELELVQLDRGQWGLTDRGQFLRLEHELTLADAAVEYAGPLADLWADLPLALSNDAGWKPPDIFGQVAGSGARCAGHHRMLRSYARHDYPPVVPALGLKDGERVIDAGGGIGVLAQMIVASNPSVEVTVVDRPEVVEMGQRMTPDSAVRWRAGDLFEPWGIEADAVVLSRVLHDWDDADAVRILRRARESLATGGRVLIVEMLVGDDDFGGAMCDLHLLAVTGGRERSLRQYESLLQQAGFALGGVRRPDALPAVVEGVVA